MQTDSVPGSFVFTVAVTVERDKPNGIAIMTEPKVDSRTLFEMRQMLDIRRHDLHDGIYNVTYSATEGCQVTGPDTSSADTVRRLLSEEMAMLGVALTSAAKRLEFTPDVMERYALRQASAVVEFLSMDPPVQIKPGFVGYMVGCPIGGVERYVAAKTLAALRDVPEPEEETRRVAMKQMRDELEKMDLPVVHETTTFIGGWECKHPFATFLNAKLQARLDEFALQIERRAVDVIREMVVRAGHEHERLLDQLAAWD